MSKKEKYTTPKNYFSKLDERVWHAVNNAKEEIKDEAPTLYQQANKTGYLIPKNYFNSFEFTIPKKNRIFVLGRTIVGLAASFGLMLTCYSILNNPSQSTNLLLADLDDNDIYEYLLEDPESLDEELLADHLLTGNLNDLEIEEFIDIITIDDILELEDL